GEKRLGAGERLKGRLLVVKVILLKLAKTEKGLSLTSRQAEVHEPALRALIGSDRGTAFFGFVGPAQRVGVGQLRLRQGPLAIRRGRPSRLVQPEIAGAARAGRERLPDAQLDPELAREIRHP